MLDVNLRMVMLLGKLLRSENARLRLFC